MNRIVFIIISLLMSLSLLVACSDNSDETTGENENSNDNQDEEVAAEPEEPEENNDTNATNDESSSGYNIEYGEDLDLPEGFPADIPLPNLDESSITSVISEEEHMLGIAYSINLDYTGDKSFEEIVDMYKKYMDSNFEEYETFEEEERYGEYSGYVDDGREYSFAIMESALEENLITISITIWANE